ncbi:response regulator [Poseidonibacter ostreae]|uniref:Response regulator n=1 Tax=Poseidonibacter ostreae TaxID=2654171 RepID=A0A6L4WQ16_9BACT|nr:response regulator [Poseidonibacter ostreae]KAB7886473.1 response regulator [Poseidonibacter ostreae]KAB7887454.1 response regulator [Poseidonibacter ostreae]KAB7891833.1 response regulator [Poseidonibacter ostreae]
MSFENMNIVSIDDNENNLFSIEIICNDMNLNVKSFMEPLEALMYCLQNNVDMILIDYMMPNINGLEFIEEFRKNKKIYQ